MYNIGQYVPRNSIIHSIDPRTKIIFVIIFSFIILKADTIGLLVVAFLIISISLLAKLSPFTLIKGVKPFLPFILILFVMYIFFTPGDPLLTFPLGTIKITYQGLYLGMTQIGRFIFLLLNASLLTLTTSPTDITIGLERLLRPLKIIGISSHNIAMMISIALRFVPLLLEEMNIRKEAQLSRGANFNSSSVLGKIKSIKHLTIPLLVSIFKRGDELVDAMEARGYHPGPRTYIKDLAFNPLDYVVISFSFIFAIILILL